MKTFYKCFLLAIVLTLIGTNLSAQATASYKNGFESETENALWSFTSSSSVNKWVVGTKQKRSGANGLYVSYDNGVNSGYQNEATTVTFASRTLTLAEGNYSAFFDFKNYASDGDSLFVCWVTDMSIDLQANADGTFPAALRSSVVYSTPTQTSNLWRTGAFNFCSNGQPSKLVYVWTKKVTTADATQKAAIIVIDNIQINANTQSYRTGFDTPQEREGWVIHTAENLKNKWIFGSRVFLSGSKSLYISSGDEKYNYDGSASGYCSAVKEFTLQAGEVYNVDFDFMCNGEVNDFMYVCWITDSAFSSWTTNNNHYVPSGITNGAKAAIEGDRKKINLLPVWEHGSFQVLGTGKPEKLVFFWVNNATQNASPGAAVDNLSITKAASCPKPQNMTVENVATDLVVTWDTEPGATYQILHKNTFDTIRSVPVLYNNVTSPYTISNLTMGAHSVLLRRICPDVTLSCNIVGNDTSAWSAVHHKLLVTGAGCINYTDLTNRNVVIPTHGTWSGSATDQAFAIEELRPNWHSVMSKPIYDRNTLNRVTGAPGLLTVPYGELATVKLGDDVTGDRSCEGLTYKLTVDSTYKLLVMKYAVVLEDPNHSETEQPIFRLQLYNDQNRLISPTCGNINFIPGKNTNNWDSIKAGDGVKTTNSKVRWKNWTTIGLNLSDYVGQEIKIKISSWDCSQGAHFGYGYFMLNCVEQTITGLSCKDEVSDTIWAPDGFAYCWFKKYDINGNILGDENMPRAQLNCVSENRWLVPASNDTSTYICKISLLANDTVVEACSFGLTARVGPRFPHAKSKMELDCQDECKNYWKFTDQSVFLGANGTVVANADRVRWTIREGSATGDIFTDVNGKVCKDMSSRTERLLFPPEGGTYTVLMSAGTNECEDDTTYTFTVPAFKGNSVKNRSLVVCPPQLPFTFKDDLLPRDTVLNATGIYVLTSDAGPCNCVDTVKLDFKVENEIVVKDTVQICEGKNITLQDSVITTPGIYKWRFKNQHNCDSTMIYNVVVNPILNVSILPIGVVCAQEDESFKITYQNSGSAIPTKYTVDFNNAVNGANDRGFENFSVTENITNEITVPLPAKIRPDKYELTLTFEDSQYDCGDSKVTVPFDVDYPSWIIEQNWNDVIAVLNKNFNGPEKTAAGGYEFEKYQWYKNNEPIAGETKSLIHISGGLDPNSQYKLELKRVGEPYTLFTCAITPKTYVEKQTEPTFNSASNVLALHNNKNGMVEVWTPTGIRLSTHKIVEGKTTITNPGVAGVYIVLVKYDDGITKSYKIIY